MGASSQGTVKLSDGREIAIDVSTLKVREWREFWDSVTPPEQTDKTIARVTGLGVADLEEMLRDDYRRLFDKIVELSNHPLDDPKNSQSAST